jgi:hypothetical protein
MIVLAGVIYPPGLGRAGMAQSVYKPLKRGHNLRSHVPSRGTMPLRWPGAISNSSPSTAGPDALKRDWAMLGEDRGDAVGDSGA